MLHIYTVDEKYRNVYTVYDDPYYYFSWIWKDPYNFWNNTKIWNWDYPIYIPRTSNYYPIYQHDKYYKHNRVPRRPHPSKTLILINTLYKYIYF